MQQKENSEMVSVGLPTYNRPDLLRRALEIITTQTYINLEIIVSDNASTDPRVKEVVDEFASLDSRIVYFRQDQNVGVLANADFVLKKSQGEYFTWFSDDDWRAPEFIEILVSELKKNKNVDHAFCDYYEVLKDGSRAAGYPSKHIKVFKPFQSRFRLVRTLSYYWQNATQGKCNIFYAVHRKAAIDSLDLKKISGDFQHLNMDCLIVFSLLQKSPVSVCSEVMCTLTCGNEKHYPEAKWGKTIVSKFLDFWCEHRNDLVLYSRNTNHLIEKLCIYCLFFPKLAALLTAIIAKKVKRSTEHHEEKTRSCERSHPGYKPKLEMNQASNPKIQLPNVTLVAMATRNVEETLQALVYSCRGIEFGSVKLLSHYTPYGLGKNIEFIRIEKIKSIDDWSYKIIYDLNQHIDTEFALLVHADGFVVNPSSWREEFLDYDYIGAPWPLPTDDFSYRDNQGNIIRVGNSVSLRSKRLLELPVKLNLPWEPYCGFYNEDGYICVKNRHIYESNGMKFASLDVAKYFSHEAMIPEVQNIKPFVFHKWAGSNRIYPKF